MRYCGIYSDFYNLDIVALSSWVSKFAKFTPLGFLQNKKLAPVVTNVELELKINCQKLV